MTEHAASVGNGNVASRPRRGFSFTVSSFKCACVIAVSVSGIALAQILMPAQSSPWWTIALSAMVLLVGLTIINRCVYEIAARSPARAQRLSGPLQRWFSRGSEARSTNSNGTNSSNGTTPTEIDVEAHMELEERVLAAAESSVNVDQRDLEMLRSILRLDVSTAREIMVPRLDIVAVDVNSSLTEVAASMGAYGHSRVPVFEETLDNIIGMVHSMDLLTMLSEGRRDASLRDAIRPAFFIPESKRLDDLLEELQEKAFQMAIVVDEYGGTEGLVTLEDLLEEIVGEIEDEFSRAQDPEVVRFPDGSALVDAGVTTDEIKELFGVPLDSTDVDTVGGYVYQTLGRIPQTGDIVVTDRVQIEVVSIMGRRLRKLRIEPIRDSSVAQPIS